MPVRKARGLLLLHIFNYIWTVHKAVLKRMNASPISFQEFILSTEPNNSRSGISPESIRQGIREHLKYTLGLDDYTTTRSDLFMALAYTIRDRLMNQWIKTLQTHYSQNVKRVYYLSLEFLMGRALGNNIINLNLEKEIAAALDEMGYTLEELEELEVDAGLGNGGLGRLAACFLDSLATLNFPAYGYGIRYDYGIFKQKIEDGYQREQPDDWLKSGNPWEIERHEITIPVSFGGKVETFLENGVKKSRWVDTQQIIGIAYDTPIVGYGGNTVNTLRLWSARAPEEFDFEDFSRGNYVEAVSEKVQAENITKVLYPNDKLYLGKELRLRQQYFFVACSLHDILRRFRKQKAPWKTFPDFAAIQLNDTHPSIAIPELMRLLIDLEGLEWNDAWNITVKTMGYTNHTLMPEALEKWPLPMMEKLLPRHLQIIFEINHRFLKKAESEFSGDTGKIRKVSIIEESNPKQIRMANLAIIGSHSVNGVAALHTELLKNRLVPEFSALFPERFNNKTNGITQRRWLLHANSALAALITETIGNGWITDFSQISRLKPFADDPIFKEKFAAVKRLAKIRLAEKLTREYKIGINPDSFIDVQIKRIHEYKRQFLNALHIVMHYNRLKKENPDNYFPTTYLFSGKAAPGYERAKLIIKFINNISTIINNDKTLKGKLKVFFIPNYRVSLAEKIIPAADLSEQISTAGTEASGTGNMKFMCNGAITIGTMDGANIEIVKEAGRENEIVFGLTAEEAAKLKPVYDPNEYYRNDPEIKEAVDLIFSGYFNPDEPGIFDPLKTMLFDEGDTFMHLADLRSYSDAHEKALELYGKRTEWNKKAVLNIASAGKFSSDRTITEYTRDIWHLKKCSVGH